MDGEGVLGLSAPYDFLAPINPKAAADAVQRLVAAPRRLLEYPRIGEKLDEFAPREIRRLLVGSYRNSL